MDDKDIPNGGILASSGIGWHKMYEAKKWYKGKRNMDAEIHSSPLLVQRW